MREGGGRSWQGVIISFHKNYRERGHKSCETMIGGSRDDVSAPTFQWSSIRGAGGRPCTYCNQAGTGDWRQFSDRGLRIIGKSGRGEGGTCLVPLGEREERGRRVLSPSQAWADYPAHASSVQSRRPVDYGSGGREGCKGRSFPWENTGPVPKKGGMQETGGRGCT